MKICKYCKEKFKSKFNLIRHVNKIHKQKVFKCSECTNSFHRKDVLKRHLKTHNAITFELMQSAHRGYLKCFKGNFSKSYKDLTKFLVDQKSSLSNLLKEQLIDLKKLRYFLCLKIKFYKPTESEKNIEGHFCSTAHRLWSKLGIELTISEAYDKIKQSIEAFVKHGSGWVIDSIVSLEIHVGKYEPLRGLGGEVELPDDIQNKKAILDVKSPHGECLKYAILASLHPVDHYHNPNRISSYEKYKDEINITYPPSLDYLSKIEKYNKISLFVYGLEDKEIFPIYTTKDDSFNCVELLLYKNHYFTIRNLNRLISSNENRSWTCHYCLFGFSRKDSCEQHEKRCKQYGGQRAHYPSNSFMEYKPSGFEYPHPFVIYADFECFTKPITVKNAYQEHVPNSFAFVVVDPSKKVEYHRVYRGENVAEQFLEEILVKSSELIKILKTTKPMEMSEDNEKDFQMAVNCNLCNEPLYHDRVRDHDHYSGKYRGAAHNFCNLIYHCDYKIPVIFHNLKNYDGHFIIRALNNTKFKQKIHVIPVNAEKYTSFIWGDIIFLDSFQFMSSSLDSLAKNIETFQILEQVYSNQLLKQKGIYPYDFVMDHECFKNTCLPAKKMFYNKLNDENISDEEYAHALSVWESLNCKTFGDYHDIYLLTDVLLLADIFENFRATCLQTYQLDATHFFSAPGLAWSTALKMTGVKLELLSDADMHIFFEQLRGGVAFIGKRFVTANNPYVDKFKKKLPINYLMYYDINNLYGLSLQEPLPIGEFQWLTEADIDMLDINSISKDNEYGYVLEVDLDYPTSLHEVHNSLPLAPEKLAVREEMLSNFQKSMEHNENDKTMKLIPNLNPKTNYVIHYRTLQFYLKHGLVLNKIHRVIRFKQSAWLAPYINLNTEKRKNATNNFDRDFFKLMVNSVFGKSMENKRKRQTIEVVNDHKRAKHLLSRPTYKKSIIIDTNLSIFSMSKRSVCLDRPIYIGFTVLDLAKMFLYQFHYEQMLPKYGYQNLDVCMSDTDSLLYEVRTKDLYKDMIELKEEYLDTSNYPPEHFLFSLKNNKKIGLMKDEMGGIALEQFVGLKPKMYSLKWKNDEKNVGKGIKKSVLKRKLNHQDYVDAHLVKKVKLIDQNLIRSRGHKVQSIKQRRIGLNPFDNKRYLMGDNIHTLAYGHVTLT